MSVTDNSWSNRQLLGATASCPSWRFHAIKELRFVETDQVTNSKRCLFRQLCTAPCASFKDAVSNRSSYAAGLLSLIAQGITPPARRTTRDESSFVMFWNRKPFIAFEHVSRCTKWWRTSRAVTLRMHSRSNTKVHKHSAKGSGRTRKTFRSLTSL